MSENLQTLVNFKDLPRYCCRVINGEPTICTIKATPIKTEAWGVDWQQSSKNYKFFFNKTFTFDDIVYKVNTFPSKNAYGYITIGYKLEPL